MKITDINTFHAYDGRRNNIFLEIETDEGITGVGEAYSIGPDQSVLSMLEESPAMRACGSGEIPPSPKE